MLRHGGAVTVTSGRLSRSLMLAADREWPVVNASLQVAGSGTAATFVEVLSGGYVTLSLSNGTEVARRAPDGSTELGLLFDVTGAAAPGGDAGR